MLSKGQQSKQASPPREIVVTSVDGGTVPAEVTETWKAFAERAIEPNPFCHPAFVLPWLGEIPEGRNGYVLFAWLRLADDDARLVGVLPIVCERIRFRLLRIAKQPEIFGAWTPPLLDGERPEEILQALLSALVDRGANSLLLPHLGSKGPVWEAIQTLGRMNGHAVALLRSSDLALLVTRAPNPVGRDAKRFSRYARQRRRLSEKGLLQFSVATGEDLQTSLDQFASLEAASWKGARKTAFSVLPGGRSFLNEMLRHVRGSNLLGVAALSLDRKVIASAIVLNSKSSAYYFKIAHDQAYARYSPGVLLTLYLTEYWRNFLDIDRVDSLATADNSLINRFWPDRLDVGTVLIATGRSGQLNFVLSCWFEKLRENARLLTRRFRTQRWKLRKDGNDPETDVYRSA